MKNNPKSRRAFLFKGLTDKAELVSEIQTLLHGEEEETEKVKMLTKDGKLVEVDRRIIEKTTSKSKATNEEIRTWIHHGNKE